MTSSNPLFCLQSKDIHFTDIEDERNQKDVHLEEAGIRKLRFRIVPLKLTTQHNFLKVLFDFYLTFISKRRQVNLSHLLSWDKRYLVFLLKTDVIINYQINCRLISFDFIKLICKLCF